MQQTLKPEPAAPVAPAQAGVAGAERRRVLHRLRRAHGQLAAVIKAVEEDRPCRDVITQLAAVSSALDRAGVVYLSNTMQECLGPGSRAGPDADLSAAEFEKLLLMLT